MFSYYSFYKRIFIIIFFFCLVILSARPVQFPEKFDPMGKFGLSVENTLSFKTRADSLDCELVGGWFRGPSYAVSIVDTVAYLGAGLCIKILNVKDSTNPILLGEVRFPSGVAFDIVVKDTLAYVADISEGLRIIDVSDPFTPTEIGFCETPGEAIALWVQDTFAYIVDYGFLGNQNFALHIINVSDPFNPIIVSSYSDLWYPHDVWVEDSIAYVAGSDLYIINVSDPSLPDTISVFSDTRYFYDVYVRDTLVYAAGIYEPVISNYVLFISIINIADPSLPVEVGSYDLNLDFGDDLYEIGNIWIKDSLAYLAVSSRTAEPDSCGLYIVDVSEPASMNEVGNYLTGRGRTQDVCVKDNLAYVSCYADYYDNPEGLLVVDISEPSSPTEVGEYDTGLQIRSVWVEDSFAYVSNRGRGLNIINVSDPSTPFEVGFCDSRSILGPVDVWVQDTFAYMADLDSGLCVINIASPFSPTEVGICDIPGNANDVFLQDTLAYVTEGNDGLHIISVSDPSNPTEIGSYDTPSWAEGVWVQDTLAYVAADSLYIINVSNPSSPTEVASIPGGSGGIFIKDTFAYVCNDYGGGLHIINVSEPSSPDEISFFNTPGEYDDGIWVQGNLAYVANGDSGLRVIDVSNPFSPTEVGFYNAYWDLFAHDVYVKDSLIYVAYGRGGLYIFKYAGYLPEPFITVTVPNGGEVWQAGSNHNITWVSDGTSGNLRIEYSTDNGSSWSELIASMPDTGSYTWLIPDNPSDSCLVRVTDTDGNSSDTSDAVFTISSTSSYVTVTSPNGGEVWKVDSTYDVTWNSNGTSGNVRIEYSTDNESNWLELIASAPDTGSYPWVIPDNTSDSCLVRISDTVGNPSDVSDSIFTISSGSGIENGQVLREEVSVLNSHSGIKIQYSLPKKEKVKVEIYNVLGQREKKLLDEIRPSGRYTLNWKGNNGVYFVRVEIGERVYKEKVVILR